MQRQPIDEIKESLLGVVQKMSDTLKGAPEGLSSLTKQLYEFNRLSLQMTMSGGLSPADKKLLEKARDVVESQIHPLLETNNQQKQDLKQAMQNAGKGLDKVIEQAQAPSTPRGPGK